MAFRDIKDKRKYENRRYKENPEYFKANTKKWRINNREWFMWSSARCRSKSKGLPFDIEISDICIPDICPVLGIPIKRDNIAVKDDSPSLDRIIPELGYVKGNIQVMSQKANTMKSNATPEELRTFARWVLTTI